MQNIWDMYHQVMEIVSASGGRRATDSADGGGSCMITMRRPCALDGPQISRLIADCAPLDTNSAYCNLLQCTDFAQTCIVAETQAGLVGWISAYRPPNAPDRLFVWQVAVSAAARGQGLAGRMLDELLARPEVRGVKALTTTITAGNASSWALFEAFARRHRATLTRTPRFECEAHFAGAHETEWEAKIAPLQVEPDPARPTQPETSA